MEAPCEQVDLLGVTREPGQVASANHDVEQHETARDLCRACRPAVAMVWVADRDKQPPAVQVIDVPPVGASAEPHRELAPDEPVQKRADVLPVADPGERLVVASKTGSTKAMIAFGANDAGSCRWRERERAFDLFALRDETDDNRRV